MKQLKGGTYFDERGRLDYVNEFDLSRVKRFYKITHFDTKTIRAWQVHKLETKWIHCIKGSFEIKIANLITKEIENFTLKESKTTVLKIPANNANGFRALEKNSTLLIFSDMFLEETKEDNTRLEVGAFGETWLP